MSEAVTATLEQFLTKADILQKTKISSTALWEAVKDGRFPAPIQLLGPRTIRWRLRDVQAFIDQRDYQPIPVAHNKGKQ
jgi:predicted DNA-binding transcriptional regulator AlpA